MNVWTNRQNHVHQVYVGLTTMTDYVILSKCMFVSRCWVVHITIYTILSNLASLEMM